jgi:AraC-like DNA-binding protein
MKESLTRVLLAADQRQTVSSLLPADIPQVDALPQCKWRETHFHLHSHREAMLVLSGTGTLSLNGKVYRTQPGTLLLIDRKERHDEGYHPENGQGRHLWLMIHDDLVNCILDEVDNQGNFSVRERYLFSSVELISKLNDLWDRRKQLNAALVVRGIQAILEIILCELVWNDSLATSKSETIADSHHKLTKVIEQHIQNNHGANSSIQELATISGYSAIHLMRIFRRYTGKTIHEYVDACRKKHYRHCLTRNLRRKEIAAELGFSSIASLSHWCKRKQLER